MKNPQSASAAAINTICAISPLVLAEHLTPHLNDHLSHSSTFTIQRPKTVTPRPILIDDYANAFFCLTRSFLA